jgi:Asp-tRNA(Asn)/Glu-tRNA(Gln) amidotransferase A subunit family amidase
MKKCWMASCADHCMGSLRIQFRISCSGGRQSCVIAIGTETNGSIVCPSNNNGIVGIKPTVGLISRTGIIPISDTQDTGGPMARTGKDAAICLGTLTGKDPQDSKTQDPSRIAHSDYTQFWIWTVFRAKE